MIWLGIGIKANLLCCQFCFVRFVTALTKFLFMLRHDHTEMTSILRASRLSEKITTTKRHFSHPVNRLDVRVPGLVLITQGTDGRSRGIWMSSYHSLMGIARLTQAIFDPLRSGPLVWEYLAAKSLASIPIMAPSAMGSSKGGDSML
jgi:hypothetical protein